MELTVPSFVTRAQRQALWHNPGMRALLGLSTLLLSGLLLLQIAMQQRNWLAARQPALQPALQSLCQVLDCTLEPWRQLDAVVIDNSSFGKARDSNYRFLLTLRNRSHLPVATPAIELILSNVNEQTVLRRVLLPGELQLPERITAREELEAAVLLTVDLPQTQDTVANYRVRLFYP